MEPLANERHIDAWTDFHRIHLGYHMFDDIKLTAAVLRGLAYHEGGHCRHTVPFPDLIDVGPSGGHRAR